MIDIENELFTQITKPIRAEYSKKYPKLFVSGMYVDTPAQFPCITIEEADNQSYDRTATNEEIENHAYLLYEVNVYSNDIKKRKSICKELIGAVDNEFEKLGFRRITLLSTPNLADATIYRMTARYRAVVDKNHVIYRR